MSPEQKTHYDEQRRALVRLLAKPFLSDLDRKRVLSCLANLRMLCDSTFLFDKQTNVSPKLTEFTELVQELLTDSGHKAVVFSQWEVMIQKAAEVLDAAGVGYTLLHGRIPGKDRRQLMDRFRDDPNCRVFLSTDAGGTGLNLQSADTVINLEAPWNPAVLEQRVARVHRMGQDRPVRVIHLVTRNSIEERVQRVMEQKRALFAGLFDGETDEVNFAGAGPASIFGHGARAARRRANRRREPPGAGGSACDASDRRRAVPGSVGRRDFGREARVPGGFDAPRHDRIADNSEPPGRG